MLDSFLSPIIISSTIRLTTPILLIAIGGSFGQKARVLNIGLESFTLISAFFAMFGSYLFESAIIGLLFGVTSGIMASCVFALFVLYFKSNPIITGIALNLSAWGFTTFLLDLNFGVRGVFMSPRIKSFPIIQIPFIKDIPYLGSILSGYNILVYFAFIMVAVMWVVMYKTPFGLRLRGVGIKEVAAQTVGVHTIKYKTIAILLGGLFAGIAGSFLSIGGASMFTENMSDGKGFLALAAIMVGDGNPFLVFLAALVFGYTSALSVNLQALNIPSQIVLAVPYVITILILFSSTMFMKYKYLFKRTNKVKITS